MGVQTMKQLVILTLLINIALGANIRKPEPESSFVEEQSDYLFNKAKFDEYEIYVQNQAIETPKLDGKILKSSDYRTFQNVSFPFLESRLTWGNQRSRIQ